jgi:hypothetical protein
LFDLPRVCAASAHREFGLLNTDAGPTKVETVRLPVPAAEAEAQLSRSAARNASVAAPHGHADRRLEERAVRTRAERRSDCTMTLMADPLRDVTQRGVCTPPVYEKASMTRAPA